MIQSVQHKEEEMARKKAKKAGVTIAPGRVIRERRQQAGWKASMLARRAGVNSRTLNAIEMGRIKSPSLAHLQALSKALGVSVATFFSDQSPDSDQAFLLGDQKGKQTIEFPKDGFRIVCYTPLVQQLFVGKIMLRGETKIERHNLPTSGMVFTQPLIGKLAVWFDGKEHLIREGNYTFFDGTFPHHFYNPLHREISFLLVTTPSFLIRRS